MNLAKTLLGGLAIAGLTVAQPLAAQASATRSMQSVSAAGVKAPVSGVRAGSAAANGEQLANEDGAGGLFWLGGLVLASGLFIWAVIDDDKDGLPASP